MAHNFPAGRRALVWPGPVSGLRSRPPTPPTPAADRGAALAVRPPGERRVLLMAGAYCLLGALFVTLWLWRGPPARVVAANPLPTPPITWCFPDDPTPAPALPPPPPT